MQSKKKFNWLTIFVLFFLIYFDSFRVFSNRFHIEAW